jgi:hypothetical protein
MLQGTLSLAVVLSAAVVNAQNLEKPGAAPEPEPSPSSSSSSGPAAFADGGQLVLSFERLIGFNWEHETIGSASGSRTSYAILGNGSAVQGFPYDWPRLGFDYFVMKPISVGLAGGFYRSTSGSAATNAYSIAPRVGYGMLLGPALAIWPRAGVTYSYATNTYSLTAITLDLQGVFIVSQHLMVTAAPVVNIGVAGKNGAASAKTTTLGVQLGLAVPF